MKARYLFVTFLTLIFYNLSRIFGNLYLAHTSWYQNMMHDNLHHYQLGVILIPLSFLILRKYPKIKHIVLAIAIGMIIDESMYLMQFFKLQNYDHQHLQGFIFEWVVFAIYSSFSILCYNSPV